MKHIHAKDILLYEDAHILAVNKPPGLTSETDNQEGSVTVADILKRQYPEAMLCHRLDRETSGVLLAARDADTYRHISILFQKRKIKKEYHALAAGIHHLVEQLVELPIEKKGSNKAVVEKRFGKLAQTTFNSLENFKHYTLIQALPHTGRFHQIRVHMAATGRPICGDALYGGNEFFLSEIKKGYQLSKKEEVERPIIARTALHAFKLEFEDTEGKNIIIEAPYYKDMDTALKQLRKFDQPLR